jgi:hypothetical protein
VACSGDGLAAVPPVRHMPGLATAKVRLYILYCIALYYMQLSEMRLYCCAKGDWPNGRGQHVRDRRGGLDDARRRRGDDHSDGGTSSLYISFYYDYI